MKQMTRYAVMVAVLVWAATSETGRAVSTTNIFNNVTSNLTTYAVSLGGGNTLVEIWTNGSVVNISSDLQMLAGGNAEAKIILDGSQGYIGGTATYPIQIQSGGTNTLSVVNGSLLVVTNGPGTYVFLNSAGLGTLELIDSTMRLIGPGGEMYVDYNGGQLGVNSPGETWLRMQNSLLDMGGRVMAVGHAGRFGGALIQNSTITNLYEFWVGTSGANGLVTLSNSVARGGTSYSMRVGGGANRAGILTLDQSTYTASALYAFLGGSATTTGILNVVNGSLLDQPNLQLGVGRIGRGFLNVTNSTVRVAALDIGGWGTVIAESGGIGLVNNDGGTVRANQVHLGTTTDSQGTYNGTGNSLLLAPSVRLGNVANSTGTVVLAGNSLVLVTNVAQTATFNVGAVGRGVLTMNGGTVTADRFIATNGANSVINFNAGTINARTTFVTNGTAFVIGDGVSAAKFNTVGGTHSFGSGVTVANNGTLAGTGNVLGNVSVATGGIVSPGQSPGVITVTGNLAFGDGAVYHWELDNVTNDVTKVTGQLSFGANLTLELVNLPGRFVTPSEQFLLFEYGTLAGWSPTGGPASGLPSLPNVNVVFTSLQSSSAFRLWDTGGQIWLTGVQWAPEPSVCGLLAIGAALVRWRRRR